MKRTRRTTVTVEVERVMVLRSSPGSSAVMWCRACARQVVMVSPEGAALAIGCSVRTVLRDVEAGHLHGTESLDGRLRICVNCLNFTGEA